MTAEQTDIAGIDVLRADSEATPAWLARFKPGDHFRLQKFLDSRVVYYPGSGTDGQPVAVFGRTRAAHCFVLADYLAPRSEIERALVPPAQGFRGYRSLARVEVGEAVLAPPGWLCHLEPREMPSPSQMFRTIPPYAFLEILERREDFGPEHGADRLAILFLGADGIVNYDWFFCKTGQRTPYAVVVQDNGFGGNYSTFGQGGLLHRIAQRSGRAPELLVIAEPSSTPWDGYTRLPEPLQPFGGKHGNSRFLYRLDQ